MTLRDLFRLQLLYDNIGILKNCERASWLPSLSPLSLKMLEASLALQMTRNVAIDNSCLWFLFLGISHDCTLTASFQTSYVDSLALANIYGLSARKRKETGRTRAHKLVCVFQAVFFFPKWQSKFWKVKYHNGNKYSSLEEMMIWEAFVWSESLYTRFISYFKVSLKSLRNAASKEFYKIERIVFQFYKHKVKII